MNYSANEATSFQSKSTTAAFVWTRALSIPFWVMLNTLSLILYKEFKVSPLLLTLFIALKPATALLATYWSHYSCQKEKFLVFNLVLTNVLRFVPFLLIFFIHSPLYMFFAFCIYMTLSRGAVPAWMEIFKRNLPNESQSKVFALGNTIEYIGTTLFPLLIGIAQDLNNKSWQIIFPLTAFLGLCSTFFLSRIPLKVTVENKPVIKNPVFSPWKKSFELLKKHAHFRRYILGFMLGGAGLMIIQPVLPFFFVDVLDLSYTEMVLAIAVCKGIGFSLTSPFWVKAFRKFNLFYFSAWVAFLASLFPLFLLGAQWSIALIFIAYLFYGFMQSGSELSWHMSAVTFSKEEPSLAFSETNMLLVGIRGCIIPFLGNFLFLCSGSITVMITSSLLCLLGTYFLFSFKRKELVSI